MPRAEFEFPDYTSEHWQRVQRALEKQPDLFDQLSELLKLPTLQRIEETRDDSIVDFLNQGLSAGAVQVSRVANQSISHDTVTSVIWDTEDLATTDDAEWDGSTGVTFHAEGLWIITCGIRYPLSTGGTQRSSFLRINGVSNVTGANSPATASPPSIRNNFSYHYEAVDGDTFEVQCHHNEGSAENITGFFHAVYLGQL